MSRALGARTSRRGFLTRSTVVGAAVVAAPSAFLLRPNSAEAAVCGGRSTCSGGYTVFCCTINRGLNACPPNTFVAGWWKADASAYCCDSSGRPAARYYVDCNGLCQCRTGCATGVDTNAERQRNHCSSACVACEGGCNSDSSTCDQRRVCRNYFRYGQCHTEIDCSGPVVCRIVSCTPPYQLYSECTSLTLTDNRTGDHTAPCLPGTCA